VFEIPHGFVLIRPQAAAEATEAGLFIPTVGQEPPPKGTVVLEPTVQPPLWPHVGDVVHHKPYAGYPVPLLMPGAPPIFRCRHCNTLDTEFGLPKLCPRNGDVTTGALGPHEFEEREPEPREYLVLDVRDVLLIERAVN